MCCQIGKKITRILFVGNSIKCIHQYKEGINHECNHGSKLFDYTLDESDKENRSHLIPLIKKHNVDVQFRRALLILLKLRGVIKLEAVSLDVQKYREYLFDNRSDIPAYIKQPNPE